MRNYKAMGDEKLARTIRELRAGQGEAVQKAGDPKAELEICLSLAKERGLDTGDGDEPSPEDHVQAKARATLLASPVLPMLCHEPKHKEIVDGIPTPRVPEGDDWMMETKYDGIRMICQVTEDGVRAWGGRNGADHTASVPDVVRALEHLPVGTIVDGERVTSDSAWKSGVAGFTGYIAFDLLQVGPTSIMHLGWLERRRLLEDADVEMGDVVMLSYVIGATQALHDEWVEQGLEGSVCKKLESVYRPGKRSWDWLKIKPQQTAEAVVIGYKMGKGESNKDRVGALEIQMIGDLTPESSVAYDCTVEEAKSRLGTTCEMLVSAISDTGKPRHPVFHKWRPDRDRVTA